MPSSRHRYLTGTARSNVANASFGWDPANKVPKKSGCFVLHIEYWLGCGIRRANLEGVISPFPYYIFGELKSPIYFPNHRVVDSFSLRKTRNIEIFTTNIRIRRVLTLPFCFVGFRYGGKGPAMQNSRIKNILDP